MSKTSKNKTTKKSTEDKAKKKSASKKAESKSSADTSAKKELKAPAKTKKKVNIKDYIPLVERVAKVEYRRIPQHMVDYEELVNIGAMAIQALIKNKTQAQADKMNTSYMATAIRWAIRNELRTRYKWYTLKHTQEKEVEIDDDSTKSGKSAEKVREAVYETILSIEGIQEGMDSDAPYDFISDNDATPDEKIEIAELGRAIKRCIESLPPKERTIMEYRFYRNMQVKDIAEQVNLSSSRITRIVQASLDMIREMLKEEDHYD